MPQCQSPRSGGEALTLELPPGSEAHFSDVAGGASDFRAGRHRDWSFCSSEDTRVSRGLVTWLTQLVLPLLRVISGVPQVISGCFHNTAAAREALRELGLRGLPQASERLTLDSWCCHWGALVCFQEKRAECSLKLRRQEGQGHRKGWKIHEKSYFVHARAGEEPDSPPSRKRLINSWGIQS